MKKENKVRSNEIHEYKTGIIKKQVDTIREWISNIDINHYYKTLTACDDKNMHECMITLIDNTAQAWVEAHLLK